MTDDDGTLVLGQETVTTRFDDRSMPAWMSGGFGWGTYVADARWEFDGKPRAQDLGNTYGAAVTYLWDAVTRELSSVSLNRERVDGAEVDVAYTYDAAGNVTSVIDAPTHPTGAGQRDAQCFRYDGLRRLQTAWTDADADCGRAAVTSAVVGGVAEYWSEFAYDGLGNRTGKTDRVGSVTTVTEYTHGGGSAGPHQLTAVTETTGGVSVSTGFMWDAAGNQTSRTVDGDVQTLEWDPEGELVGVTGAGGDVANVFAADGTRLVRVDDDGVTVFLPGGQEVRSDGAGVSATRWYTFAGSTVATRTGVGMGAVASVVTDPHGTPVAHVHNTNWAAPVNRVRTDPFGQARVGQAGTLAGRGFLGAPADPTGLTLLGARFYDPATGTFVSVDPELTPGVPAQFNAYVYAGNNPLTWADPSGRNWFADAWKATTKFVDKYQAEIAGFVVGGLVTAGCLAATAGAGSVACFVAGGAAAGAVTNIWKQSQSKKPFNVGSLAADIGLGGALGLLGPAVGALGRVIAPAASMVTGAITNAIKPAITRLPSALKPAAAGAGGAGTRASTGGAQALGSGKATACTVNSFVPGTLVVLADGSAAPIESLQVGDEVLATDPVTEETTAEQVVATITGTGVKDLVTITVTTDEGLAGEVTATAGHPFWVPDRAQWVDAGDLLPGDWLQTSSGTWVQVSAVEHDHREQTVHNLTVDTVHTYYVYAGDTAVLSHNCGGGPGGGAALLKYDADFAMGQVTSGGRATASQLDEFGSAQGWVRSQSATGPVKFSDANGVVRLTIKQGSSRAPGSGGPHVELRNAGGLRVDPLGNAVTRRSTGNHTPIIWDW